jgi:hypothetical protein
MSVANDVPRLVHEISTGSELVPSKLIKFCLKKLNRISTYFLAQANLSLHSSI